MKKFFKNIFYNPESKNFKKINSFLALLTIISVISISLETVDNLKVYSNYFYFIEIFSTFFFTLEYFGRVMEAKRKRKYIFSFFGLIDLLAILPTILGLGNLTFLKSARLLRVLRFLRILKLTKIKKLENKKYDPDEVFIKINLEIYLIILFISLFFSSVLIWFLEGNREVFSSIPMSML